MREALEKKGALDDTFVVVTSDHGHTRVAHEERNALEMDGAAVAPDDTAREP